MKPQENQIQKVTSAEWLTSASKKQVKADAVTVASSFPDPVSCFVAAKRLSEFSAALIAELKPSLSEQISEGEKVEAIGGTVYFQGGGHRYAGAASFGHDEEWQRLTAALKAREADMKHADSKPPGEVIFDSEGVEIPRAVPVASSPSLMCSF